MLPNIFAEACTFACAAMVALVVEDTESHAFLREGVDLS